MQIVHSADDVEIVSRYRPGQVVDATVADPEEARLLGDGQGVVAVIIALRSAGRLCERAGQRITAERQLANLGVKRLHVRRRRGRLQFRLGTERPGSSLEELGLLGRDLVRVNVELLGQFGQRLLAAQSSQRRFCLEIRAMVPPRTLAHRLS